VPAEAGSSQNHIEALVARLGEMPPDAPLSYVYLWQLENWLRQMVYVELKSELGQGWTKAIKAQGVERSRDADLYMSHMPGPERQLLAFSSLGVLAGIIESRWDLFESYLPPKEIWQAKLKEVAQVRHRIAHFRYGNSSDARRVANFLQDIDQGVLRFCASYNDTKPVLPPDRDPIALDTANRAGGIPYVHTEENKWVMLDSPRIHDRLSAHVEVNIRPWVGPISPPYCGKAGVVYSLEFTGFKAHFEYELILAGTARYEADLLHVLLSPSMNSLRFTLPAVLGEQRLIDLVGGLFKVVLQNTMGGREYDDAEQLQRLANEWPEYVLGPSNPLTYASPGVRATFFLL
jgi:hypothetical protein